MKTPIIILLALGLTASACEDKIEQKELTLEPKFRLTFILSDSAGHNILPYNLPDDPIFYPEGFSAHSHWNDSIGKVIRHREYGYFFSMTEKLGNITNDPVFQRDSTFTFYPCFKTDCDTVTIYKTNVRPDDIDSLVLGCSAQKIIWNHDTFYDYHCSPLPIEKF